MIFLSCFNVKCYTVNPNYTMATEDLQSIKKSTNEETLSYKVISYVMNIHLKK